MSLSESYHGLLSRKRVSFEPRGIEVDDLCTAMFPHQENVTRFLLKAGCGAAFLDTGLGKSLIALDWGRAIADHTGKPVLMLAPLAVGPQHAREAEKFGIDAEYLREPTDAALPPVVITNYERLHLWDASEFSGVVLDECFAPDTPIDCVDSAGKIYQKYIEDIHAGDHILNAAGVDVVSDVHRREIPHAIRVRYGGQSVLASPNHPFLTSAGWKGAMDLVPGDEIVATATAVQILRPNIHGEVRSGGKDAILRTILLSEMADASAGAPCESSFSRRRGAARREKKRLVAQRQAGSFSRNGTHSLAQSDVKSRNARKSLPPIERDEARTFRAWGKRAWFDATAIGFDGCAARQLDGGICFVTGASDSRLSNALQTRLSQYREKNSYRGGWSLAPFARRSRPEERSEADFLRVEGIEVLELGNPELDKYRDADGKLYFYDIGGTRHPSFSIHGGLVHNSSILKSFQGRTKSALIEAFRSTSYRLACTATPAPNDHMELGNHAEFLGAMRSAEMLSRWFVNDTSTASQKWRLKGHAADHFWDWVASWARCVSKPSDIGHSDDGFALPALVEHNHIVAADRSLDAGETDQGQALLFRIPEMSATSIHKEKRLTVKARAQIAAEIVFGDWECRGSQSMPSAGAPNIAQAKKNESAESRNADPATKTSPICVNTTRKSQKNSAETQNIKPSATRVDGNDTPQIQNSESYAKDTHGKGVLKSVETDASNPHSESPPLITTGSQINKVEHAHCATPLPQTSKGAGSQSTTVTQQESSAVFYAQAATKDSDSSKTIQSYCDEQQPTSSERDWWIIWCDTDYEQDELERLFGDAAISIRGSHSSDKKESLHEAWLRGDKKALICKPVMFGHGLNWQHCCKMFFVGLSFSYESYYQAIRRCWRFGQKRPVHVHVAMADTEKAIFDTIARKSEDHDTMKRAMTLAMRRAMRSERQRPYDAAMDMALPAWLM